MKNYRLKTSEGVRDYLGNEALLKEKVETNVRNFLLHYGYELVKTPTFEYVDVFATEDFFQQPDLYTLINRQGEFLALRNDMTSSIARVVATKCQNEILPKKYCYVENTFRYPLRYQGKSHEFTQAGIELIGDGSIKSDVEVIKIAIQSLISLGIKSFSVHVGYSQFLETLFDDLKLNFNQKQIIQNFIDMKDFVSFKDYLKQIKLDKEMIDTMTNLMLSAGKLSYLETVKKKLAKYSCSKCLQRLFDLYHHLEKLHLEQYIVFDFSIYSYAKYYTGIIFQIFTLGLGRPIVSGGRYDSFLKKFGFDAPAIGFGMDVDGLVDLLKGLIIDECLFDNLDEAIKYGKEKNYNSLLVYQNNQVKIIQLEDDNI